MFAEPERYDRDRDELMHSSNSSKPTTLVSGEHKITEKFASPMAESYWDV